MHIDVMMSSGTWGDVARRARAYEAAGLSGILFSETSQVPWMMIAATAAPTLTFSTGIAVAFPRSPMVSAQVAWELAQNTDGRFRLGLGSQVRGHIERRYLATWDKPAPQMRDYVGAVKACLAAFRGEAKLDHHGPYYNLTSLPSQWRPPRHAFENIAVDISAVGPYMCRIAGELCDGLHVHPMHSMHYINNRLLSEVAKGAAKASRNADDIDLIVPVFAVAGDSADARATQLHRARTQISFYGSTPNYAFQFDDLGFKGTTQRLNALIREGDTAQMAATITDEMLDEFALVRRWDDMADALLERYRGIAHRVVLYLTDEDVGNTPAHLARWGEIARAVRQG
ncbi:MAG: LLM class F420-dependent oxidoreductase [Gammaproteobacteria bacterium]|nr:LLM class F420-dependent oxidoreductase [Gammaproteobacteria bacterium]